VWILDAYSEGSTVHLWIKEEGRAKERMVELPKYFYLHLPEPSLYSEMLENLETIYKVEACSFKTIYGVLEGYKIYAGRNVAERIERQTKFSAKLYNVDVRLEQRFFAESGVFPCGSGSRFDPEFEVPVSVMDVDAKLSGFNFEIRSLRVRFYAEGLRERRLTSKDLTLAFFNLVEEIDPDVVLLNMADAIVGTFEKLENPMSRSGRFRKLASKSYWSYGRVRYREKALLPEGRILVDKNSFNFREGGLKGILLASRLTALSPNLTARFTPGTLISAYEVYEALKRGIAVPFRKSDPENQKSFTELKKVDRGGIILQPKPGFYENVYQLDFTSMYPSIIVKYNLSPETISKPSVRGFLPDVLKPLLEIRMRTKKLKKKDFEYKGLDSILKWMLVTCFGYTGYRNARFGRIEVHESINKVGREILLKTKEIAEKMGFEVIHGMVDCLWLRGGDALTLKRVVEEETGMSTGLEFYNWIVFLPMRDGFGAYNRYFGRLSSGRMKLRGIAARRRDTPAYIKKMQLEILGKLSRAGDGYEVCKMKDEILKIIIAIERISGMRNRSSSLLGRLSAEESM
jgi:DNA polymerase I